MISSSASSTSSSYNYYDRGNQALQPLLNDILRANNFNETTSLTNLSALNFSNINTLNRTDSHKVANKESNCKNVNTLIKFLIEAIQNFVKQSSDLANEYPELNNELTIEIDNIVEKGNKTFEASKQFANDPLSTQKRKIMVDASRELLNSVGRLLAIADSIDAHILTKVTDSIQANLNKMKNAFGEQDLMLFYDNYKRDLKDLLVLTGRKELTNPVLKNEFASARSTLAKHSPFLISASRVYLNHPKHEAIERLHTQVYNDVFGAIDTIQGIVTNRINSDNLDLDDIKRANIFNSLIDLEKRFSEINPAKCKEESLNKLDIEIKVETSCKNISKLAIQDLNRKKRIVTEANELKSCLIALFKSFEDYKNNYTDWSQVEKNKHDYIRRSKIIRSQVRKAIAELFLLEKDDNINYLIDAALNVNNQIELKNYQDIFCVYGNKLIESSLMACYLSNNVEGVQIVEMETLRLKNLVSHIIDSTNIVNAYKTSNVAINNIELFRNSWLNETKILRLAVDDILSINDLLSVCEKSLFENMNGCISAINDMNINTFEQFNINSSKLIGRICDIADAEINNYESCDFIDKVYEMILMLKNKLYTNFKRSSEYVLDSLSCSPIRDPNENDFIEASRLVYDGVRDLRNSLLMIPQEDYDNLCDYEDENEDNNINSSSNFSNLNCNNLMQQENIYCEENIYYEEEEGDENRPPMSKEQREQLNKQLNSFRQEKNNFDREVLKWDDRSNDIIVLSKEMCVIMMDMTNFTRKKGPFKNTNDILNAARKISVIGSKLEKLCRDLADECPESQSKRELLNYLNLLPLFCNQLNIGVKVKENIIFPDSASSLIISSKNLMNAVISVVKFSYVASTKYVNKTSDKKPIVQWKMKPPELKPLVNVNKSNEVTGLVRKVGQNQEAKFAPVKTLSQFQL